MQYKQWLETVEFGPIVHIIWFSYQKWRNISYDTNRNKHSKVGFINSVSCKESLHPKITIKKLRMAMFICPLLKCIITENWYVT